MKRQSVDQKQVLHHRNVEDERHHLQSALTDVDETTSSDVDNNGDIPTQSPSSQPCLDSVQSTEKDVEPTVIPDHGMCRSLTLVFNGNIIPQPSLTL